MELYPCVFIVQRACVSQSKWSIGRTSKASLHCVFGQRHQRGRWPLLSHIGKFLLLLLLLLRPPQGVETQIQPHFAKFCQFLPNPANSAQTRGPYRSLCNNQYVKSNLYNFIQIITYAYFALFIFQGGETKEKRRDQTSNGRKAKRGGKTAEGATGEEESRGRQEEGRGDEGENGGKRTRTRTRTRSRTNRLSQFLAADSDFPQSRNRRWCRHQTAAIRNSVATATAASATATTAAAAEDRIAARPDNEGKVGQREKVSERRTATAIETVGR